MFSTPGEGRDLVAASASKAGVFDPPALHRAGRPVVLIQNSIHAGEMDGTDSCLALLRDMRITQERSALLSRAVAVTVSISTADRHQRFGPYTRLYQKARE